MAELQEMTRRRFLEAAGRTAGAIGASCMVAGAGGSACLAAETPLPPVTVFSKVYQELKLDFAQSAEVTAEAGLDGIDCPVRPGGEILPEQAADRMPQYAEVLAKRGLRMFLLSTAIQGVSSPHTQEILTTGKRLGIRYYRLGFWTHRPGVAAEKLRAQVKSSLKELSAMNREMGLCALFQNHSSPYTKTGGFVGGDLGELYEIVRDLDPELVAVAFDLGHALITHGDQWRTHFQRIKDHMRVVYVKDVLRPARFVPFDQGDFARTGFFALLARLNYRAPFSLHTEYEWAPKGKKTRAALVETLRHNREVLKRWWRGT